MTEERGRQGRLDQVTQERRRRDGNEDADARSALAIPADVKARLAAEGKTPRWINDDGNRIHQLTVLDDYDMVEGVEPVPIGTSKEGKPIKAYLAAKPIAFIEEDRKKRETARQEKEAGMMKGIVPGAQPIPGTAYTPSGNTLGRGSQTLE